VIVLLQLIAQQLRQQPLVFNDEHVHTSVDLSEETQGVQLLPQMSRLRSSRGFQVPLVRLSSGG
jgi:hypothetical protein